MKEMRNRNREKNILDMLRKLIKFENRNHYELEFATSMIINTALFLATESKALEIIAPIPAWLYHLTPALLHIASLTTEGIARAKLYKTMEELREKTSRDHEYHVRANAKKTIESAPSYVQGMEPETIFGKKHIFYRGIDTVPVSLFPPMGVANSIWILYGAAKNLKDLRTIRSKMKG